LSIPLLEDNPFGQPIIRNALVQQDNPNFPFYINGERIANLSAMEDEVQKESFSRVKSRQYWISRAMI